MRKSRKNFWIFLSIVLITFSFVSADTQYDCLMNGGTWNEGVSYSSCSYSSSFFQMVQQPIEQNFGGGITSFDEYQPKEKTQEQRDCEKQGCYEDLRKKCYPYGYIKDGTYCYEKAKVYTTNIYGSGFVNQSETGRSCIQGYECKTGICSNNVCVNLTEQQKKIESLNVSLTQLSQENVNLKQGLDEMQNISQETNETVEEDNSLIQKIVGFLKDWLGFS